MSAAVALKPLEHLPRTPASDVKKLGWRGVMRAVARSGKVLVTNHDQPEAVILPVEEYTAILNLLRDAAARDEAALESLRRKFDERLQWLDAPGADEAIDAMFGAPLDLQGKTFTGEEF